MITNKHIIIHWIESEKNVGAIIEGEKENHPCCARKSRFPAKVLYAEKLLCLPQIKQIHKKTDNVIAQIVCHDT